MRKKVFFKTITAICMLLISGSVVTASDNTLQNSNTLKLSYNSEKNCIKQSRPGIIHRRAKRWLNGKPAIINVIVVDPLISKATIKPSYGEYSLNSIKSVKEFVEIEKAIAGINASYFKPDMGVPLGASIIDGEVLTGQIYDRVVFGISNDNSFEMEQINISGVLNIETLDLKVFNINQPVFSNDGFTIFTDRWGTNTPQTSEHYVHIVVQNDKITKIKQSSISIPKDGYVAVGPRKLVTGLIHNNDKVSYKIDVMPYKWENIKYAVGGGPYLVKKGNIYIDDQKFSKKFIDSKEPRTAIGYTKGGSLVLATIDGRNKGISEGATIAELAQIMWELGCYNAMNLDGGSSTQMVFNGKIVNSPTVKGGGKVTNALVIIP